MGEGCVYALIDVCRIPGRYYRRSRVDAVPGGSRLDICRKPGRLRCHLHFLWMIRCHILVRIRTRGPFGIDRMVRLLALLVCILRIG